MSLSKAVLSPSFTGAFPCRQPLAGPRNPWQPLYVAAEAECSLQPGKGSICYSHRNYFGGWGRLSWPSCFLSSDQGEWGTNRTPTFSLILKLQWPKKKKKKIKKKAGSIESKQSVGTNSFVAGKETKKPKHICAYASLTIFLLLSRSTPTDISNPNYLGMAPFSQQPSATCQLKQTPSSEQAPSLWNYEQQSKENTSLMGQSHSSSTSPSLSPLSPKPSLQPTASRSICNWSQEYQWVFEFCTEAGSSLLSFCTVTVSLSV